VLEILINGEKVVTASDVISEILTERSIGLRGIAIAVNSNIVPRSEWSHTVVHQGDVVEIVTAASGG
jgi:sulfur carrier protein